MKPGDVYVLNAPYRGGTHLPDITVIMPVFADGRRRRPGTSPRAATMPISAASRRDRCRPTAGASQEEGVLIDNVLLVDRGRFLEAEMRALLGSGDWPARNPDRNIADLKAQIAACARGANELRRVAAEQGREAVDAYMGHVMAYAEEAVRRPSDLGEYIGKTIECKIMVIDEARRNIVVSRRRLIEDQRTTMKAKLLAEIEPGQIRKGVVKNIAEFGAFVDLGGIDGLLHITDMSWGRVNNPHEVVKIDQELEVYIIKVDKDKEKIALGLKQKSAEPVGRRGREIPDRQPA